MRESLVLDSMSGDPMPKPYSGDLRARVIGDIVSGASRRAAAEYYGISPSVVVIWAQRFETTGSVAAKPSGRSTSPLAKHARFLLARIAKQPDLTLDEIVADALDGARALAEIDHMIAAGVRFGCVLADAGYG